MSDAVGTDRVTHAPEVILTGISTVYDEGDDPVLHDLRLRCAPGEITILMGPSGAGKTTLIRHVAGLLRPDRGTVRIGERDIWTDDEEEVRAIRKGMSFMLGGSSLWDTSLFGSRSALDNLVYSLKAHDVPLPDREPRALAALAALALEAEADRLPENLPAHARKRLALARALVVRAPFVALDEVDGGLDAAHTKRILTAVKRNHERTGATMLISTHNLALARTLGDSLAVLGNGRILAHGPVEETLRGVHSSQDFAARFLVRDPIGPPRKEDLGPDVDEENYRGERKEWFIEDRVIWLGVIGLILVAFLVVLIATVPR